MEKTSSKNWKFKEMLQKFSKDYMIVFALIALVIVFSIVNENYLTRDNIITIFLQTSTIAIVAVGQGMLIMMGKVDISLGYSVCLSCFVSATLMHDFGWNPWLALLAGILTCVAAGTITGIFTAYLRVPAFIAALAMQNVCKGFAMMITNARVVAPLPESIRFIGKGYIGPIPFSVILMIFIVIVMHLVMQYTRFGRTIYAIGGNPEAAFFVGVNVEKYYVLVYALSGLFAGISASVLVSRLNAASTTNGVGYEFEAMIAACVGGVSFTGGKGKMLGILFGALFSVALFNGMTMANVNAFLQNVIKGIVLLAAVTLDVQRNHK